MPTSVAKYRGEGAKAVQEASHPWHMAPVRGREIGQVRGGPAERDRCCRR
jgi:hypothetical protein